MSELINNRQEQLKALIRSIHDGLPLADAKQRFKEEFGTITTEEITSMEQSLIQEGMPIEHVQKLCDVHAAVFDGAIADIHKASELTAIAGHPAQVLRAENDLLQALLDEEIRPYLGTYGDTNRLMLTIALERLSEVSKHYSRKENLLFPGLEKRGIDSIPKVMWGVDNEIRALIKESKALLSNREVETTKLDQTIRLMVEKVEDMITKENNILLPLLIDTLSLYDWILADEGADEIGYFLAPPSKRWADVQQQDGLKRIDLDEDVAPTTTNHQDVAFDAGTLNPVELNSILNTLPLDMTFVDKDGHVKYFTQGTERIFERPKTILGRHVNMCHPPQSVHVVEEIVRRFETGEADHEDFWIRMKDFFVHIRYFAIRDQDGRFLGTLEVTQNIQPLRDLEGEKRLLDA